MTRPMIATHPLGRWQARLDAVPPLAWLGAQALALWPHGRWAAARLSDGSDDPLGVVALAAFAGAVWLLRDTLRARPRRGWWLAALTGTALASLAPGAMPPLAGAVVAALSLAAGLRAFLPSGTGWAPFAGLSVLSLPVLSSLQFYAGFPLRVVTAEMSTWALHAVGVAAERSGSAMQVNGQLIVVDAPCSGVQMVWMAYFCACVMALARALPDRAFVRRLPAVGLLVLAGNVLRNLVLVGLEARGAPVPEAVHAGVGLAVLAGVCAAVVAVVTRPSDPSERPLKGLR